MSEGKQFDENTASVGCHAGPYGVELPDSLPESTGTTPGVGSFNFSGKQYDTDGEGYGTDATAAPSATETSYTNDKSERGAE